MPTKEATQLAALADALARAARDQVLADAIRRAELAEARPTFAPIAAWPDNQPTMIFSGEHGAFWRARGEGYTIRADMAGQWRLADAQAQVAGAGPEKMLTLIPLAETLAPIPTADR